VKPVADKRASSAKPKNLMPVLAAEKPKPAGKQALKSPNKSAVRNSISKERSPQSTTKKQVKKPAVEEQKTILEPEPATPTP